MSGPPRRRAAALMDGGYGVGTDLRTSVTRIELGKDYPATSGSLARKECRFK